MSYNMHEGQLLFIYLIQKCKKKILFLIFKSIKSVIQSDNEDYSWIEGIQT